MRRPELDYILSTMLDSQPEFFDLLFTVDKPLQVESFGELKPVSCEPPIEKLTPFQTEMIAHEIEGDHLGLKRLEFFAWRITGVWMQLARRYHCPRLSHREQ